MLLNRVEELKLLKNLYLEKKPKLLIVYGRRRVGKTALLTEFSKNHKILYLMSRQESVKDQLTKMSSEIADYLGDNMLKINPLQNYDALFSYLHSKKISFVFDEFPFLVESNKALPSILQEYWDKHFSRADSLIILCGSSVRMMESLLGYKSPLYGRRTEQILIEPLKFKDACLFFPKLSPEEKIKTYAILGGTPAYLLEFDYSLKLIENIKENILMKNKFLYQDVDFVLKEELNEPRTYYSIVKSVSKGNTKIGNIMNDTGYDKGKVTKYLSVLRSIHIIERVVPITETNPEKSRNGVYLLKDNYFKFWFRFVFQNEEYIEQGKKEKLIIEKIEPGLNSFTGVAFEEISRDWVKEQKKFNNYLIGKWWDKEEEIDIVGVDKHNNKLLVGEVKWSSLSGKEVLGEFEKLKQKSEKIMWGDKPTKEFIIIAKEIKGKKDLISKGNYVFDLEDIV